MSDANLQRDIGRMESKVETLVDQVATLTEKIDAVEKTLSEAKGGWRVLMLVAGASATIGGLIVKFMPFLSSRP